MSSTTTTVRVCTPGVRVVVYNGSSKHPPTSAKASDVTFKTYKQVLASDPLPFGAAPGILAINVGKGQFAQAWTPSSSLLGNQQLYLLNPSGDAEGLHKTGTLFDRCTIQPVDLYMWTECTTGPFTPDWPTPTARVRGQ